MSIGPLGTNLSQILLERLKIPIHENAFENVIWKCRPLTRYIKELRYSDLAEWFGV